MAINQAYLFLIFTLNGVLIGLLFDFFRILRKITKNINIITYIEDILFWILTGISIIFSMYKFSDGSLRIFMFLGLGFGISIYMLTLSKLIIQTFTFIINTIKKIIMKIIKIILFPFKILYNIIDKAILRPLYIFYIKADVFLTKYFKKTTLKINNIKKVKKFDIFEGFRKKMENNNIE